MSCWQSTILLLYHREKVTFALPRVRPVGPIACNVLKINGLVENQSLQGSQDRSATRLVLGSFCPLALFSPGMKTAEYRFVTIE